MKKILQNHLINYPTPINLSYMFSFGFLAGLILFSQIISGIFLSMYYSNNINLAFESIEFFVRNINYGWFIRYVHSNGASFFFLVIYIHILKGFYYKSYLYPRHLIWISGLILFLLLMAIAFLGYVLPWGQMSFWGATVITSLFSVIPFLGEILVNWLWGGFSIDNPTLMRFFIFHFILPFILLSFVLIHLNLLHKKGSSNIFFLENINEKIKFYPYFLYKDFLSFLILSFIFIFVISYYPNFFNHSDNYIKANPLLTPTHIVPEWYFLPFYAILRSIENKSLGVFFMFFSILILFFLPLNSYIQIYFFKNNNNYFYFFNVWSFFIVFLLLGWVGQLPVNSYTLILGKILTLFYFFFIFNFFFNKYIFFNFFLFFLIVFYLFSLNFFLKIHINLIFFIIFYFFYFNKKIILFYNSIVNLLWHNLIF